MGIVAIQSGILYLAVFDNGISKIGITRNIERRVKQLKSAPSPLTEVYYREVDFVRQAEAAWHEYFSDKHTHLEFFSLSVDDIDFFCSHDIDLFPDIRLGGQGQTRKINARLSFMQNVERITGGNFKDFEAQCREEHKRFRYQRPGLALRDYMKQKLNMIEASVE